MKKQSSILPETPPSVRLDNYCRDLIEALDGVIEDLKEPVMYNTDRLSNIVYVLCSANTGKNSAEITKVANYILAHVQKMFAEHVKDSPGKDMGPAKPSKIENLK